ncbi:ZPR1 zinc-finger domain-containing protein [Powellomyces hirtus]|nr:ZPR1 zinc-finger domain-containing protein [Powellomyces hirtus]
MADNTNATLVDESGQGAMDLVIPRPCPNCGAIVNGKAALVDIPHFKEVAHLILDCSNCATRSETYKSGHRVEEKGTRITLNVESKRDFERKLLKGENCTIEIPSLGLEIPASTLPARFIPIADFLHRALTDILRQAQATGQGGNPELKQFVQKLMAFMDADLLPATIIFDDPAGNTYLESFSAPEVDPTIVTEEYERSVMQEALVGSSYDHTPI